MSDHFHHKITKLLRKQIVFLSLAVWYVHKIFISPFSFSDLKYGLKSASFFIPSYCILFHLLTFSSPFPLIVNH